MKTTRQLLTTDRLLIVGAKDFRDLSCISLLPHKLGGVDADDIMMAFDGNFTDRLIDYLIETDEHCDDMIDYNEKSRHELTNDELVEVFRVRLSNNR